MRPSRHVFLVAALIGLTGAQLDAPQRLAAQTVHADQNDRLSGDDFASDPAGAVDRARKSVAKGDLPGAIAALRMYAAAHPRELGPARYLGDLYYRAGDLRTAERVYSDVLKFAPADAETHDRLGGIYAAQDRVADAIDQFTRSLPETSAYDRLVDLHRRLGDLSKFEEQVRATADGDLTSAAAAFAIGTIFVADHRSPEAVPYLERALLLQPNSCPALAQLGVAYADLGEYADAERTIGRCIALDPNNYAANVNLGTVLVTVGRTDDARAAFDRANRVRPDGPEALVDIGYVEDVHQHWDAAVRYYLRAIAADPLARDAYVDLGFDYDEHRLFALAEAAYLKGLSIAPGDGRLHYLLGVAYSDQGKRDLALAQYRAAAAASDEPEVVQAAAHSLSRLQ